MEFKMIKLNLLGEIGYLTNLKIHTAGKMKYQNSKSTKSKGTFVVFTESNNNNSICTFTLRGHLNLP